MGDSTFRGLNIAWQKNQTKLQLQINKQLKAVSRVKEWKRNIVGGGEEAWREIKH